MPDPAPRPRLPQSAPKPVKPRPPVGILVEKSNKPTRPSSKPLLSTPAPPPTDSWRPLLVKMLLAMVATVVFIGGMELGFHRAANRYQPVIDELGGSMKKQADQLAGAKKEIASQSAALVALKESWKLAETKRVEAAKKIPPAPKVSELESMLTKKPEPPPEKKVEPAKKIEIAKTPDPVPQPPAPMPSAKPVRFASDIKPIFDSKCVLCHGGKSTKGGLSLLTAAKTKAGGNVGPGFVPGKIEESTLLEYIGDNRMPPGNTKLTVAEKKQIREWILQGGN